MINKIKSSTKGKHGGRMYKVECIGIFDKKKRIELFPRGTRVEVPLIEKRRAQVNYMTEDKLSIMDVDSYEQYDVSWPSNENLTKAIKNKCQNADISNLILEFWIILDEIIIKSINIKNG